MPHWKSMMDREYIFYFDLDGKDRTLTIDRVVAGELVGEGGRKSKKPLCYFKEVKSGKPLALNSTNSRTIAGMYGDNTDDWPGKRVTLFPTKTQMGGEERGCIRIRPRIPPAAGKPEQSEEREPGAEG